MSALTMRPRGPDPCTNERSIPARSAIRFANGEAKIRPLDLGGSPRSLSHPPARRRAFGAGEACGEWEGGLTDAPSPARCARATSRAGEGESGAFGVCVFVCLLTACLIDSIAEEISTE